jgi:DNA-binding NtrC family response regulator
MIALFASEKVPLPAIEAVLRREELNVSSFVLTSRLAKLDPAPAIKTGVLVTNETGVVNIGEQTEHVRSLLPQKTSLLLCAPQVATSAHEMLLELGASDIVAPESWHPQHIGERIFGHVALGGEVVRNKYGALRGATKSARDVYSQIDTLAPLSETILILGETGTGKELVAREMHNRSGRNGPYVPINAPELDPNLISSELFGHVKGAFSGADKTRVGLIASAGEGTVFIDEIGDLDLQSQAKLLRVLEERTVRKVGANQFERIHARIILATNRDLQTACQKRKFRSDLYERIRGFTVQLSPLRERKPDIPILARHFVDDYNNEYQTNNRISATSADCLFQYDWPGNIRELRAVIRKGAAYADSSGYISPLIMQDSTRKTPSSVKPGGLEFDPAVEKWRDVQRRMQTAYFRALLAYTNGNRESAIKLSGLSKSQFFEKLKDLSREE